MPNLPAALTPIPVELEQLIGGQAGTPFHGQCFGATNVSVTNDGGQLETNWTATFTTPGLGQAAK